MLHNNVSRITLAVFACLLLCAASLMIIFRFSSVFAQNSNGSMEKRTIIIDPGHGGVDGGAVGVGGVVEKNINLSLSLKLRSFFLSAGYEVIMTREDDRSIHDDSAKTVRGQKTSDLYNRLAIIKQHPTAVFVSIHMNKFEQSQYSGTQVFYSPKNPQSKILAQTIQTTIHNMLQPDNDREIKQAGKNLFIMYNAPSPAVLVECGFLSNPKEAEMLQTQEYQNKLAFSIFCAVVHTYGGEEPIK